MFITSVDNPSAEMFVARLTPVERMVIYGAHNADILEYLRQVHFGVDAISSDEMIRAKEIISTQFIAKSNEMIF